MGDHTPKRLYLDSCTLCRPFDDQNQMRIRLETNAYYLILQALQEARYTMMVSPVHFEEANAISDAEERQEIRAVLERLGQEAECEVAAARARAEKLHARIWSCRCRACSVCRGDSGRIHLV